MKRVLILGAGRSSSALIEYLLEHAAEDGLEVTVADNNLTLATAKTGKHPNAKAVKLNVHNSDKKRELLGKADIVVSLLPAHLHMEVARDCLELGKHLITASYVSPEMTEIAREARKKGLIFMGELGLDPGVDHMSAMDRIDYLHSQGASITSFRSYTGGLVAPESDDNPWHYKISWNPRNVVLAGQGTAQYLKNGRLKYIPYHQLFKRYELVDIEGVGKFEMYANRDSLVYRSKYGLDNIPTLIRGTLRHIGFCEAWDALRRIGLTDDSFPIVDSRELSYRQLVEAFMIEDSSKSLEEKVAEALDLDVDSNVMYKLKWLGLFDEEPIDLRQATPAYIIEELIKKKWALRPDDKDLIIMQHEFLYRQDGKDRELTSTLIMKGEDHVRTAMSKLVGLPIGIFVRQVMKGKIKRTGGTEIPIRKNIYKPILHELEEYGVRFRETTRTIKLDQLSH